MNEENAGRKYYANSTYSGLRKTLEDIIRSNLSLENNLVFAQTTILKIKKIFEKSLTSFEILV